MELRFAEARELLTEAVWTREPLHGLAQAIAQARDLRDPAEAERQAAGPLRELRTHIRGQFALIRTGLDKLLEEVPCTPRSKILFMEMVTGHPRLPRDWDPATLAGDMQQRLHVHLAFPWEEQRTGYDRRLKDEGPQSAYLWDKDISEWYARRKNAVSRELYLEALSIVQHLHEAWEKWNRCKGASTTFMDHFSAEQWAALKEAMNDTGIAPKEGKGKNDLVAALHAGFIRYGIPLPNPGHWVDLLRTTYPMVTWNEKSVPEARPAYRGASYKRAFQAVTDRLG